MPTYGFKCTGCEKKQDRILKIAERNSLQHCDTCGEQLERIWDLGAAVGDEIDIEIQHGLCNIDGTPRRYRSKSEIAKEAKKRGFTQYAVATDGDKHLKKWF